MAELPDTRRFPAPRPPLLTPRSDVVYQVYPDRFRRSAAAPRIRQGQWSWRGQPIAISDDPRLLSVMPGGHHTFFGGDLQGVRDSLDHLEALGVGTLYLNPIFAAPSTHRYDPTDLLAIDPALGGRDDLEALSADLRQRGMALVLDGVFNHTSRDHPWHTSQSARRERYLMRSPDRAMTWMGGSTLPKLDTDSPLVAAEIFRVLEAWPEADGWRLDAAHLLPRGLLAEIRRRVAPRRILVEDWQHAGHYFRDRLADGVTNFLFRNAMSDFFREDCSPETLLERLSLWCGGYPAGALRSSWNLLENHDTPRFLSMAGRARLFRALVLQFTLPGCPLLFQGIELGMKGKTDGESRAPVVWERRRWDRRLLEHVRQLSALRRRSPILVSGRFHPLAAENRSRGVAFERRGRTALARVMLADGYQPFRCRLDDGDRLLAPGSWRIELETRGQEPEVIEGES